jgi:hypothetical protein
MLRNMFGSVHLFISCVVLLNIQGSLFLKLWQKCKFVGIQNSAAHDIDSMLFCHF